MHSADGMEEKGERIGLDDHADDTVAEIYTENDDDITVYVIM
jgi:hypothetical protein